MTLDLSRGTHHAKQFGGEFERSAVVEHNIQRATILREANFNRPRLGSVRLAHIATHFKRIAFASKRVVFAIKSR